MRISCTFAHVAANLSLLALITSRRITLCRIYSKEIAKMIYNCQFLVLIFVLLAVTAKAFQMPSSSRVANTGSMRMALSDYREELARTAAAIAAPGQ